MCKVWSFLQVCLKFKQVSLFTLLISSGMVQGQTVALNTRMPASYIPDDDVIVKPINNELSFYQQYVAKDESHDVIQSRNQLKVWNDNQNFADQYGLDSTLAGSPYFVPTPDEKFEYFKDKYMRYLRRKGEQPVKDAPKNWYQSYRASNEVDTIDEMEARFKSTNGSATKREQAMPESLRPKEVSFMKQTKFIFQPRVDQGLVIVGVKSPIAYARAWVGVNGRTEINIQKSVDSIGFRVMWNYYTDSGRYFTSVDQRLMENIYARVTSQKEPFASREDNTAMLLYSKSF